MYPIITTQPWSPVNQIVPGKCIENLKCDYPTCAVGHYFVLQEFILSSVNVPISQGHYVWFCSHLWHDQFGVKGYVGVIGVKKVIFTKIAISPADYMVLSWDSYSSNRYPLPKQGVGHDVIKILNFSAIQCIFNHCIKTFNYKQWCSKIIPLFQIRWVSKS